MYCIILLLLVKKMLFLCSSDLGEVHHKVKEADHTTTHWKHLAIFHTTPRCCKVRHVCLRYIPVKNQRNSHFCLQNHTRYFKIHLLFFPHSSIKIRISGRFPPPPVPLPAVVGCFELSMAWSAQELGCLPARIPTSTVLPQHEPVWDALYPGNHQRAPQNLLGEQNDSKSFGYQMTCWHLEGVDLSLHAGYPELWEISKVWKLYWSANMSRCIIDIPLIYLFCCPVQLHLLLLQYHQVHLPHGSRMPFAIGIYCTKVIPGMMYDYLAKGCVPYKSCDFSEFRVLSFFRFVSWNFVILGTQGGFSH